MVTELEACVVRGYRPGDERAIEALRSEAGAGVSEAEWRWAHLENPGGFAAFSAVGANGRLVAHCGGVGQRMLLRGEPARFLEVVATLADPVSRAGLKQPGAFVRTGRALIDVCAGAEPSRAIVSWGRASQATWRIAYRQLQAELVRTELTLVGSVDAVRPRARCRGVDVEEVSAFPEDVDALFVRVAAVLEAVAIRDRAQLDWRFTRRPGRSYSVAAARRGGELVGLAVHRRGDWEVLRDVGLCCEWLVTPGDDGARAALLTWCADRTRSAGARRLVTVLPESSPEFRFFQRAGFVARPSSRWLLARSSAKALSMHWLNRHWHYTLADSLEA